MSKKSGLLASVTIIGILTFGLTFSSYKAINEYVNGFVNSILNFLSNYGLNLSVEQFWIASAIFFLIAIIVFLSSSD